MKKHIISPEASKDLLEIIDYFANELQDFIKEVSEAFRLTDTSNEAWDVIDAIIHEWRESAIAIASPDLAAAFNDQTDEIPLTQPSISGGGGIFFHVKPILKIK
ncbi:hypothetical protein PN456_00115 [Nodularia spumigena CS-586/05]|uniref:hypothetical protein n=1 Tax=Nodularia spumigena TaxID=70799 RepID=UPI00232DAFE8|nr:hypothetical protein [Nodularia spumigena]MDB9342035.1 hypothetical protein [Nodularia spumigena CS-588/06]MDB9367372.1 hypothetical protein [Nodularia spumigena CS-586/05]